MKIFIIEKISQIYIKAIHNIWNDFMVCFYFLNSELLF